MFFAFTAYFAFLANSQYLSAQDYLPARFSQKKFKAIFEATLKIVLILWMVNYGNKLLLRGYYDFDKFERKSEYGGLSQRNFAHQAADFLVDNGIGGNFFNDFNSGAYLLGRASPQVKVFIDGRTEVYGAQFYQTYTKIWKGDTRLFGEAINRYQLTGAFLNSVYVPAPAKTIRYLYELPDWALVYFDYDAAIFLRDVPANRPWIDRYRIDLSQWQTREAELLKIGMQKVTPYRYINRAYALFNMGFPQKAEAEALEALRIEPYNAKAHKLLGRIYNERGEYARGFESLRHAKLLEPDDMKVRYQLAVSLYHLGEFEQARVQCRRVLSGKPGDQETRDLMVLIDEKMK
jgi:tetratricopeptide (TPR) repeat protein